MTTCDGLLQKTTPLEDELDLNDSEMHVTLLTAAIGDDDLAYLVCMTGMKNYNDRQKPIDHHKALASSDAEH